ESPKDVLGPINLGNPEEFTIRDLAEIVIEMTGSRSKLDYHILPVDDPQQRQPDISKAKELLGWQPGITLRDGLMRTIAYFEERLNIENA
ncbi:MAG: SDR family NAD-dependent epimerase/dehydratase, partial [Aestuariivirga sp.]|nr:SDR family NAD-dependent epimerase/dehydratase [Aestuariivirga sp.]